MDLEAPLRLDGPQSFTVRTGGDWTLSDAREFLGVIDTLYGALLTVELAAQRVRRESAGRHWAHDTLSDYVVSGMRPPEQGEQWATQPTPWRTAMAPGDLPFGPEVRYLKYLNENRYLIAPDREPRIASWRMSSPGRITIKATGGFLKQIREFIKDLRFRNRQEEALGDLEIARKQFELQQLILSPPAADYVGVTLLEGAKAYRRLEADGKILPMTNVASAIEEVVGRIREEVSPSADRSKLVSDLRAMAPADEKELPGFRVSPFENIQKQIRSFAERGVITREVQVELSRALTTIVERLEDAA